ncbi:MAG TPA: tetraacyldisaccharide 4'-kinase [Candidatus Sulfotelmatobacter sp.]
MNPLSNVYGFMGKMRNRLYDRGVLRAQRLQAAVVSVGNLSTGGTGKTPFILMLGELLKARRISFDVLSRGYGRRSRGALLVDPTGSAPEFGDEPLLIARRLNVPVIVGEDRYRAGLFAEARFRPQLHLLDDGFQHRALARDFDIVLTAPEDAQEQLLPSGRLREPLAALCRADAIVLQGAASDDAYTSFGKPIWRMSRTISPQHIAVPSVVFCGIARPQQFALQLRMAGVELAAEAFFRDHHRYTEKDIHDLLALRQKSAAAGFVTTEKDAINLGENASRLQPLSVVPLKLELKDAANVVDTILRTIAERKGSA